MPAIKPTAWLRGCLTVDGREVIRAIVEGIGVYRFHGVGDDKLVDYTVGEGLFNDVIFHTDFLDAVGDDNDHHPGHHEF